MFSIDPEEPAKLRMIGQPVSTGGDFPVSVAISEQSGQVCVLNSGKDDGVKYAFDQNGLLCVDLTTILIAAASSKIL